MKMHKIDVAVNYASAGGIPITSLYSGGKITIIQMQHIWVEAAIDYMPSHGAINKSADAWVPMDASYKQYQILAGINPVSISGVDTQTVANNFQATGTTNLQEGWVSGLDPAAVRSAENQVGLHDVEAAHGDVIILRNHTSCRCDWNSALFILEKSFGNSNKPTTARWRVHVHV